MRTIPLILLFLVSGVRAFPQEKKLNSSIYDTSAKQEILIGYCTREGLVSDHFMPGFQDEYTHYKSDSMLVRALGTMITGVTVTIVMGTWCSDSREQVPRFFRIMDNFKDFSGNVTIICVDKHKKAGDLRIDDLGITRVPTFIFYRDGFEVGRIIETPKETLEKDMISILSS
jgi:thiol-disulfide isomerase/thioredoxin